MAGRCPTAVERSTNIGILVLGLIFSLVFALFIAYIPGGGGGSLILPVDANEFLVTIYVICWLGFAIFVILLLWSILSTRKCE